jgi:hypothetical protein
MSGTRYWRAREVEDVVRQLVPLHHDHLDRQDVTIRCVYRDTPARSRGKIVLGKARKVAGLNAHLVGLVRRDDLGDDPADFFVIEVPHEVWQALKPSERRALVDHELCHFWVAIPEDPDEDRQLVMLGHDLEEFRAVVERHGLWRPDLTEFAKVLDGRSGGRPAPDQQPMLDLRDGAGLAIDLDDDAGPGGQP